MEEKKETKKTAVKLNLYQKINAVMSDVEYLQKDASVPLGKGKVYKAVSEEKVTGAVRESMIEHGLVIIPVDRNVTTTRRDFINSYGSNAVNYFSETLSKYKIINSDNPKEFEIIVSAGQGLDSSDKAIGKALTYDYKYLLLRTFAIATGLDPDVVATTGDDDKQKEDDKKVEDSPESENNSTNQVEKTPLKKLEEEVRAFLKMLREESIPGFETTNAIKKLIKSELKVERLENCKDFNALKAFNKKCGAKSDQFSVAKLMKDKGWTESKQYSFAVDFLHMPLADCFNVEKLTELRIAVLKEK